MTTMFDREGHLWLVWIHMRERCNDPDHPNYHRYGGRGIIVEEPWNSNRHLFYEWANKNGYKKGLHLNRIDNEGNYSPSNCNFITAGENSRNKESSVIITIDGETKNKVDWMAD